MQVKSSFLLGGPGWEVAVGQAGCCLTGVKACDNGLAQEHSSEQTLPMFVYVSI